MQTVFGRGAAGLALACLIGAPPASAESEPAASAIAERVMQTLGGHDAWRTTRYLRFDWAVERDGKPVIRRSHYWDKWTGDYRLESQSREGVPFVVVMNLNSREGRAWSQGAPLEGEALAERLEAGYGAWTNDSYWLLMPYKLLDPGVSLQLGTPHSSEGRTWDRLEMSFDGVGLTPKDRYWVWVDRESGLVDRWDYVLKGGDEPPTSWSWEGWADHGRLKLPNDHRALEGNARIHFPVLELPQQLPDAWQTSSAPLGE